MKRLLPLLFFIWLLIQGSCINDKYVPINNKCDTTYYARIIKPIIITNCTSSGCHDNSTVHGNFNNYLEVKEKVLEIEGGEPKFLHRLKIDLGNDGHMPVGKELSPGEIQLIEDWINNGYEGC